MEYRIIRSDRRTLALTLKDGELIVRAPRRASDRDIERFVESHLDWIERQMERARRQETAARELRPVGEKELAALYGEAKRVIPERVALYAPLVGVTYGRITVRRQKTRWGSCSAEGNLNFNCLLMLAPQNVLDSVVVHELCHIKEMNHSDRFYAEVLRVMPNYRESHGWLKENGEYLMKRLDKREK